MANWSQCNYNITIPVQFKEEVFGFDAEKEKTFICFLLDKFYDYIEDFGSGSLDFVNDASDIGSKEKDTYFATAGAGRWSFKDSFTAFMISFLNKEVSELFPLESILEEKTEKERNQLETILDCFSKWEQNENLFIGMSFVDLGEDFDFLEEMELKIFRYEHAVDDQSYQEPTKADVVMHGLYDAQDLVDVKELEDLNYIKKTFGHLMRDYVKSEREIQKIAQDCIYRRVYELVNLEENMVSVLDQGEW